MTGTGATGRSRSIPVAMARAIVVRPDLWWTALASLLRLATPGWWRTRPYLPLPDRRLWAFRMVTAYGDPTQQPGGDDVVSYLEWCRSTGRTAIGSRIPLATLRTTVTRTTRFGPAGQD